MGYPFFMEYLDWIFPVVRCAVCDRPNHGRASLCAECEEQMRNLDRSGAVTGRVARGHVLFAYEDPPRKMALSLKYRQRRDLVKLMAAPMAACAARIPLEFDVVIPVPAHWSRRWMRGFDQSRLLAEEVAARIGAPVDPTWLVRTRRTPPLKALGREARGLALRGAFAVRGEKGYSTVLLIDDIYTTGATMDACAEALFEAGTDQLAFVAFCGNE